MRKEEGLRTQSPYNSVSVDLREVTRAQAEYLGVTFEHDCHMHVVVVGAGDMF